MILCNDEREYGFLFLERQKKQDLKFFPLNAKGRLTVLELDSPKQQGSKQNRIEDPLCFRGLLQC